MAKQQLSILEQPATNYEGIIKLEHRVVIFDGNTVPLVNVAQVMNRNIPYPIKISMLLLVLFTVLAMTAIVLCISEKELLFLIATAVFATAVIYGLWERKQQPSYGLIIELVSGARYFFVSKEEAFIQGTYDAFCIAIQNGLDFVANFQNLNYTVMKGKYVNVKGSNIIEGDNLGSVTGGNYYEQMDTHDKVILEKVQNHLMAHSNGEVQKYWESFMAALADSITDKLKLTLLFEKANDLLGAQKVNEELQQEVTKLIERLP
jgi:hypothetical protein